MHRAYILGIFKKHKNRKRERKNTKKSKHSVIVYIVVQNVCDCIYY